MRHDACARFGWAALVLAAVSGSPLEAVAVNVVGTSAGISWSGATGPVTGYAVEVSRNGGAFVEVSRVPTIAVQVSGAIGDTLAVRVRAFDGSGRLGPYSTTSDSITFISAPAPNPTPTPTPTPGPSPTPTPVPTRPAGDVDGDGLSDALAFETASGEVNAVLRMRDGSHRWVSLGAPRDAKMRPAGFADVDGDGRADLLLRNAASGANELWLMRGTTYTAMPLPAQAARFRVAALRDFSGDGLADVFFHDAAEGESALWTLSGSGVTGTLPVDRAPTGTKLLAIADVDGDTAPDLVWQERSRRLQAWLLSGVEPRAVVGLGSAPYGASFVGVGDFDASGSDDLVWSKPKSQDLAVSVWFLAGTSAPLVGLAARLPSETSFRGVVDADADGRDDFVVEGKERAAYEVSPVRVPGSTTRWQTSKLWIRGGPSGTWEFVSLD